MVAWPAFVRKINDGTPVDAATTNIPITDLETRTDCLYDLIGAASAGRALTDFDVDIDAAAVAFTPVFLDDDGVYKPATSQVFDSGILAGQATRNAFVAGIVAQKTGTTRGHVTLFGIVPAVDLTAVTDTADSVPGLYYLSTTTGLLTRSRSLSSQLVGQLGPSGEFTVMRWPNDGAKEHLHYQFPLSAEPAVDDPANVVDPDNGDPHVIGLGIVDTAQRGWIPADHPIFGGNAPLGAQFGYNIAADADLAAVFPPTPIVGYGATLGQDVVSLTDQLLIDANGIWWITNDYGRVPWSVDFSTTQTAGTVYLTFASLVGDTGQIGVSSVQADDTSLVDIEVLDSAGNPATTGALFLRIAQLLTETSTTSAGATAVKSINGTDFESGPVVSGVEILTSGIVMNPEVLDAGVGYGKVQLSLDLAQINLFGTATLTRHVGTRLDQLNEFSYVGYPESRNTSTIYQFTIPTLGVPANSNARLSLMLFGLGADTLPDLVVEQRTLGSSPDSPVPASWTAVETVTGVDLAAGNSELVQLATTFAVSAGAEVLVRISRAGSTDGYVSPVGVARVQYVLEA